MGENNVVMQTILNNEFQDDKFAIYNAIFENRMSSQIVSQSNSSYKMCATDVLVDTMIFL